MISWPRISLGEVVDFFDSKRVPLSGMDRSSRQGVFPYYGASGVIDWVDDYIFDGRYLLVAEDGENLNSRKLPVAFFANGKFWVNNHAHIVRGKSGVLDDVFLQQWFAFADIGGYITGSAQPKLSQANMKRIEIPLPPFKTQQKIAEVLSSYDDLIENNNRRIQLLEEIAQRIYREWFVDFRYPGHEAVQLVDSDLGLIPQGWRIKRLGEEVELVYGKALKSESRMPGGVTVFGSGGPIGTHDEALGDGPTVIVGRKGNVGAVSWSDGPFFAIDTAYWVRSELPMTYCFYVLRDAEFLDSHAAVPGLSREQAYSLFVLVPNAEVLNQFESIIRQAFSLRRHLNETNMNLRASRNLILPRLISGEIDVTDLNIVPAGTAA